MTHGNASTCTCVCQKRRITAKTKIYTMSMFEPIKFDFILICKHVIYENFLIFNFCQFWQSWLPKMYWKTANSNWELDLVSRFVRSNTQNSIYIWPVTNSQHTMTSKIILSSISMIYIVLLRFTKFLVGKYCSNLLGMIWRIPE